MANFELFSSSPKDFTVSISDRFPTRDWSLVGQFMAKDERDIQSFDLYPHLFGRYMKVEVKSHYGSEHFCPISLFRVYGTSEFEVLEKEDQANINTLEEDVDDETLDCTDGEVPKNLFSSATDAVISIVKKAAQVLGNKGDTLNQTTASFHKQIKNITGCCDYCITPRHLVVCGNCSETTYESIYYLLSCHTRTLINVLNSTFIKTSLLHSNICINFGLEFQRGVLNSSHICGWYLNSLFSYEYLGALCNTLAVDEHIAFLNNTRSINDNTTISNIPELADIEASETISSEVVFTTSEPSQYENIVATEALLKEDDSFLLTDSLPTADIELTSQIKPTKTFNSENDLSISSEESVITKQPIELIKSEISSDSDSEKWKTATPTISEEHVDIVKNDSVHEIQNGITEIIDPVEEVLEEFSNETENISSQIASQHSVPVQAQKESVFMRLSNRIKVNKVN